VSRASSIAVGRSLALIGVALALAACGAGASSTARLSPTAAAGSGAPSSAPVASSAPSSAPVTTAAPATSVIPVGSPNTAAPTSAPGASATLAPASPSPSTVPSATFPPISSAPSAPAPAGAACSGTAENRDFFAAAAQAVSWSVYCAVLPAGWFVESGSWELRNGGKVTVMYKGPKGAQLTLNEGTYCTGGVSACSPHDHELGPVAFGDQSATLDDLGPNEPADGYAIYVNPGVAPPSWSLTGTNIDQATFTAIAAALVRVPAAT
jgi:hypothetical protein